MSFDSIIFGVVLVSAFGFFGWNLRRLIRYVQLGREENRFNDIGKRIRNVLKIAFGQTKLLREPFAGVLHFLIFWGFVILLAAIVESIGEALIPGFSLSFLGQKGSP